MTPDRLRPDLKTWRMAEAARAAVEYALEASKEEGLDMVGRSLREAGLFLTGACVTLESLGDDDRLPEPPTAMVPLTVNDLDHLIASVTGTRDRVAAMLPDGYAAAQLDDLRTRLIDAEQRLRQSAGLPLD